MSTPATGASSAQTTSNASIARNAGVSQSTGAGQKSGHNSPALMFANLLNLMASSDAAPASDAAQGAVLDGLDLGGALEATPLTGDIPAAENTSPADGTAANPLTAVMAWTTPANPWSNPAVTQRSDALNHPQPTAGPTPADATSVPATASQDADASAGSGTSAPPAATSPPAAPIATTNTAASTPLPTGMIALNQPVQADAKTMAAAEAARNTQSTETTRTSAEAATTPSHSERAATSAGMQNAAEVPAANGKRQPLQGWRSTATMGQQPPQTPANAARPSTLTLAQQAQAQSRNEPGNTAGRNTGTLTDRTEADGLPTPAAIGSLMAGSANTAGDSAGHSAGSGSPGHQIPAGAAPRGETSLDADAAQPTEGLEPDIAEEAAAYKPQHLRQVNVRVGESGENAIDIRLSLEGEALNVDFRTDSAETRSQLQQSAGSTLGDLLQRGGLQLGGVSVGAQNQGQGQGQTQNSDGGHARTEASAPSAADRADTRATTEINAEATQAVRQDGSRPLDLFV